MPRHHIRPPPDHRAQQHHEDRAIPIRVPHRKHDGRRVKEKQANLIPGFVIEITDDQVMIVGLMAFLNMINDTKSLAQLALEITCEDGPEGSVPAIAVMKVMEMYGEDAIKTTRTFLERINFPGQLGPTFYTTNPYDAERARIVKLDGGDCEAEVRSQFEKWQSKQPIQISDVEMEKMQDWLRRSDG